MSIIIEAPQETAPVPSYTPPVSLWKNRNFNIFWIGQSFSALGDAFALIALPLLVLQATGSIAQMGLVTATLGLGQLLAGPVAGVIVDRVDRRRLMILSDLGRMFIYLAIPLGWWTLGPQMWMLYVATLVGSCMGMFFQVSYITAIANLVGKRDVTNANSRLQLSYGVTFVLGPALAGILVSQFGAVSAIGINAFSFGISAISIFLIRLRALPKQPQAAKTTFMQEWLVGFRFLWNQPVLRSITFLLGAYSFLNVGILDLFVYHIKHDLGQGDDAVGLVFGFASVGSIGAAFLVGLIWKRLGFGFCMLGGIFVASIAIAFAGQAPAIGLLIPLAMIFTGADNIKGITSMSLRQRITPEAMLGRVTSVFWLCVNVPGPIGGALLTALAQQIGVGTTCWIVGGLGLVIGAVGLFTPARQRHPEEAYV